MDQKKAAARWARGRSCLPFEDRTDVGQGKQEALIQLNSHRLTANSFAASHWQRARIISARRKEPMNVAQRTDDFPTALLSGERDGVR
jgi:hypothetical protein